MSGRGRATWFAVLVTALVLLLAGAVDGAFERRFGRDAPELFDDTRVRLGETAIVDGVRVTVDRLQSSYQVEPTGKAPERASGIFLVFRLRAEAADTRNPMSLTGDVTYSGLTTEVHGLPTPDPGTGADAVAYAELDANRLRTDRHPIRLRLWHSEITYRYRQRAVVELEIDQQRADALLGVPAGTVLTLPRATTRGL